MLVLLDVQSSVVPAAQLENVLTRASCPSVSTAFWQ